MNKLNLPTLYTVPDAAKLSGLPERTLYLWCKNKTILSYPFYGSNGDDKRGKYAIPESEVKRLKILNGRV